MILLSVSHAPCKNINTHMLRMIHTARFHPICGSALAAWAAAPLDLAALAGDSSLGVRVLELPAPDCRSGVFSVAVPAVERSSASRWVAD